MWYVVCHYSFSYDKNKLDEIKQSKEATKRELIGFVYFLFTID